MTKEKLSQEEIGNLNYKAFKEELINSVRLIDESEGSLTVIKERALLIREKMDWCDDVYERMEKEDMEIQLDFKYFCGYIDCMWVYKIPGNNSI